ncbi:hypothetical protein [Comamonas testosteroni]|nr:hypothetical protein [Comamonas testosteroni]MEB5967162.1 hypothetical protein [Comamonas testosteroni]
MNANSTERGYLGFKPHITVKSDAARNHRLHYPNGNFVIKECVEKQG